MKGENKVVVYKIKQQVADWNKMTFVVIKGTYGMLPCPPGSRLRESRVLIPSRADCREVAWKHKVHILNINSFTINYKPYYLNTIINQYLITVRVIYNKYFHRYF